MQPTYYFNKHDIEFIIELAKIGFVNVLTTRVVLKSSPCGEINPKKTSGHDLKLPDNWRIEQMCIRDNSVQITFRISIKKIRGWTEKELGI